MKKKHKVIFQNWFIENEGQRCKKHLWYKKIIYNATVKEVIFYHKQKNTDYIAVSFITMAMNCIMHITLLKNYSQKQLLLFALPLKT